jgi:hypothetical protein
VVAREQVTLHRLSIASVALHHHRRGLVGRRAAAVRQVQPHDQRRDLVAQQRMALGGAHPQPRIARHPLERLRHGASVLAAQPAVRGQLGQAPAHMERVDIGRGRRAQQRRAEDEQPAAQRGQSGHEALHLPRLHHHHRAWRTRVIDEVDHVRRAAVGHQHHQVELHPLRLAQVQRRALPQLGEREQLHVQAVALGRPIRHLQDLASRHGVRNLPFFGRP